jgi:hypothetical protein
MASEELRDLYSAPNVITVIQSRMRWAGHVTHMQEMRNVYRILVWKPEGKKPLGRPTQRREDDIKLDRQEMGWKVMEWNNVAQNTDKWWDVMNMIMNIWFS